HVISTGTTSLDLGRRFRCSSSSRQASSCPTRGRITFSIASPEISLHHRAPHQVAAKNRAKKNPLNRNLKTSINSGRAPKPNSPIGKTFPYVFQVQRLRR